MADWICPRCGLFFVHPESEGLAKCPQCGGEAQAAAGGLECAMHAAAPGGFAAQAISGILSGLVLGALFVGLEWAFLWGIGRAGSRAWLRTALQAANVLFVGAWLFVNAAALGRARSRPLSVKLALALALASVLAVVPLAARLR